MTELVKHASESVQNIWNKADDNQRRKYDDSALTHKNMERRVTMLTSHGMSDTFATNLIILSQ